MATTTTILQNVVESKRCTATATDDNYNYDVTYEIMDNGKTLNSLTVSVSNKTSRVGCGSMGYQNKSKSVTANDGVDANVLLTMLNAIIAEIQAQLITE